MNKNRNIKLEDICAVVVSYNPDSLLLKNLESLIPQVGTCIIIDNHSEKREMLDQAAGQFGIEIVTLQDNMGIAYALNRGLKYCIDQDYSLMLTMDQDTVLDNNAVRSLLSCMNHTEAASVGINWDDHIENDKNVSYLITSGNLVITSIAKEIGGYDNHLFIDSVDFDFSLRLKDAGYSMIKVADAKAEHHLGEKQGENGYTTHSEERYYYIYRNHFYMIRKYWKNHKVFCLKKNMALIYDVIKILLYDDRRGKKLAMMKKGYWDSKTYS